MNKPTLRRNNVNDKQKIYEINNLKLTPFVTKYEVNVIKAKINSLEQENLFLRREIIEIKFTRFKKLGK